MTASNASVALRAALCTMILWGCGDEDPPTQDPIPIVGSPTAVALANPSAVPESGTISLDGSASSDTAGEALTYLWEQTSGPTVAIADPSAAQTTAEVPDVNENRAVSLSLTVTNQSGVQSTDLVFITIIDSGIGPTADAGTDQTVDAGVSVTLDASGSVDADGSIQNYLWERVSGPDVDLTDAATVSATFDAPDVTEPGTIVFRVSVTDSDGIGDSDTVLVTVNPVPTQLAFVAVPSATLRNTPLQPLAIEVQNSSGARIVNGSGSSAEVSLDVTVGGSALEGPTTFTAVDGEVALSETRYPTIESGVELTATSTGLTAAIQTLDVTWPSVFPGLVPGAIQVVDATQLLNQDGDPYDDAVLWLTADGTVDLDLSGTAPESITTDGQDIVLARYRTDGSLVWFRHFEAADDQSAVAMAANRDGDLIAVLELNGTVDFARSAPPLELSSEGLRNVGVVRFDGTTGDVVWATRLGGAADAVATDLALAGNGDPIVAGWFSGTFDPDPSPTVDERTSNGIDAFVLRLQDAVLLGTDGEALAFANTPSVSGDERFYAIALSSVDDINAAGSREDDGLAWVYRTDRLGNELTSFSFAGTGSTSIVYDIEARGSSIQVVGAISGDSDFGGETVITGAGGTDGFFAVYASEDDSLAFVRRVAGIGDDAITHIVRTDAFDASFIFAATVTEDASVDFGLSQETFTVTGGGEGTFVFNQSFDQRIKWSAELAPGLGASIDSLVPQIDDTLWLSSTVGGNGSLDLDPLDASVTTSASAGDGWVVHLDPAAALVVP